MDYQRFIEQLPELYDNWGQSSVSPKSNAFGAVLSQVQGMTTANAIQLLNFAVECMEPDEVYCEVGCFQGATLIGALINHPDCIAYAVDNFSRFDESGENFEILNKNLSKFDLDEQVIFCNQDFEEFFFELKEIQPAPKIGVYLYDGAHDYRSQLLGLLLVRPFLADKALIIVDDSNWSSVQQANCDFMAAHAQFKLLLDLPTPTDGHGTFWNGLHVFSWDVNQTTDYDWSNYVDKYRHQPYIKAIYDLHFEFEFNKKKTVVEALEKEALALENYNQVVEAEQKYKEILQWDKNNAKAWHALGTIYYRQGEYQDALAMLVKAVAIEPNIGLHYYELGVVLEKHGNAAGAIAAYEKAIILDSQLVDAYNNLGNILYAADKFVEAEAIYRQAGAAVPNHFGSYLNVGNVLMAQNRIGEAIEFYQKSLQLKPRDPDIIHNLGVAFDALDDSANAELYFGYAAECQGKYEDAIVHYQKILDKQTGGVSFYISLAECYNKLNKESDTIQAYQTGLSHYPTESELYLRLISALQDFGRTSEAIAVAESALQLLPNDVALQVENARLLPIIYETPEEIEFYRRRYAKHLEDVIQSTPLDSPEAIDNAFRGIGFRTNYYLQYQGKNDLYLQSLYGQFVHRVMAAKYPEWAKPLTVPPVGAGEKIRVGYVSAYLRSHTVGKLTIGWVKNHNRQEFEIYCYYTGHKQDSLSEQFRVYSDAYHHIPENLSAVCQQIAADNLHILVYPDINMHPQATKMAGLRLAAVQCKGWGHPVTSGSPTIDYYLSSDLMEPENGQEHYSEELIRVPNLGYSYAKPILPQNRKNRKQFNLGDEDVVYLCCQSLFKYLPQHDYILVEIARRVPLAKFVFIASQTSEPITNKFRQRLQKAFSGVGLNAEKYCTILPRLYDHREFLNLNLVSDVFLDTLSWSGGNTTLEAIACNLPVCTVPGEFMRGRHAYAMLKMLGVTDTIAKDEAEYMDIAARLGLDKEWRQSIVEKISQNHDRLYDDKTCVEALEAFYQRVVREGQ